MFRMARGLPGLKTSREIALAAKKILEQPRALFRQHTGPYFRAVVEAWMAQQITDRS